MKVYMCGICGFIYEDEKGDPVFECLQGDPGDVALLERMGLN